MSNFTAGPWRAEKHAVNIVDKLFIHNSDGCYLAIVDGMGPANKANAALIASAPDMLEALWEALNTIENMLQDFCDEPEKDVEANNTIATIQAALHKARGGQ